MRILALEPFYGGSHQAFLDGWREHSEHDFTVLGLPAFKWKWRMRHAPVTFAQRVSSEEFTGDQWDAIWCSDMLNLPEFLGLVSRVDVTCLPTVAYFHENQLTYPVRDPRERDLHFAYSNFTTALAANRVWFNSDFHRRDFLKALRTYLKRMPDYQAPELVDVIGEKSEVQYPGVLPLPPSEARPSAMRDTDSPLQIGWTGRWEHDKNPEDFFAALRLLKQQTIPFQIAVLGESFQNAPECFGLAKEEFGNEIVAWGYLDSLAEYRDRLRQLDVIVSTANHEFFGIGVVEAISAGALPLLPNRLAYPEVIQKLGLNAELHLYDGSVVQLAECLQRLAQEKKRNKLPSSIENSQEIARLAWPNRAAEMDRLLVDLVTDAAKTR